MTVSQRGLRSIWLVVALLAPVALLNYLDRQMLASMKFSVMHDIPDVRTDANWGVMLAQFKWFYAVLSPIGGYIADRYSRKWMICGSLFIWSAITWLTGGATTYHDLLLTRTLMGCSEAIYIPAALALIVDYHTGATKSRATGFHMAGIYLGVILGGCTGYIADDPHLGWRWAFHCIGFVGLLYAIPLSLLLRDVPRPTGELDEMRPSPIRAAQILLRNRSFLLLVLYFTLVGWPGWMVKDWMPSMLKDRFGIGQGQAGVYATLFVNVAAVAGLLLGGYWADRLSRRTIRGRLLVSGAGMAMIIPALIGLGHAPSPFVAVGFLILFGLSFAMVDCNNMPILSQIAMPNLRATGYGLMNFVSIGLGGFADIAVGASRDHGFSFEQIIDAAAVLVALNVLFVLLIKPSPELSPTVASVS